MGFHSFEIRNLNILKMNKVAYSTHPELTVVINGISQEAKKLSEFLDRMKAKWPTGIKKVNVSKYPNLKVYVQINNTKWGEVLRAYIKKFKPEGVSMNYYVKETKFTHRY
jgi:hypothetical protein